VYRVWHLLAFAVAIAVRPGHAQTASPEVAESLFQSGRARLAAGEIAEACRNFAESYRLERALGTLLNLAHCHERMGDRAGAWVEYGDALAQALAAGHEKRARFARDRRASLERNLSFLQLDVEDRSSGMRVTIDAVPVLPRETGNRIPRNPGPCTLEVSAPGKKTWTHRVDVGTEPTLLRVIIPRLGDLAGPPRPDRPASEAPPPARRAVGYSIAAAGLAAIGVGSYYGVRTLSKKREGDLHCTGTFCDDQGLELQDEARTSATVSTVSFALGIASAAVGGWLIVSAGASKPPRSSLEVTPAAQGGLAGLGIGGRF
jgi:hypothetical protein